LNQNNKEFYRLSDDIANKVAVLLSELKLIIIDEISMIGSRLFNQIDERLRQIFKRNEFLGGMSCIVVGDFNQTQSVGDGYIFESDPSCEYSKLVDSPLWYQFSFFELDEVMRQKDDAKFAKALNNIPLGKCDKEDIELLKSRCVNRKEVPENVEINLFWSNSEVDNFISKLKKLNHEQDCINLAIDTVIGMY